VHNRFDMWHFRKLRYLLAKTAHFGLLFALFQRELLKKRVTLSKLTCDMWKREHYAAMNSFLGPVDTYPCLLTVYIDSVAGLVVAESMPYGSVGEMVYFIRRRSISGECSDERSFNACISFMCTRGSMF